MIGYVMCAKISPKAGERGSGCLWVGLAFPSAFYGERRPAQVSGPCGILSAEQMFELGLSDPHSDVSDNATQQRQL